MSELNEVLLQLDFEDEEQQNENDSSFVTAADDVSWAEKTLYKEVNESCEQNSLNVTPQVENKTPTFHTAHNTVMKRFTPFSSIQKEKEARNVFQTKAQRINKAIEESVAKSMEIFDDFFGIRIRNPKISSATFNTFVEGMQKIRPSDLKPKSNPSGDWITVGVVAGKSDFRKTSNKNEYLFLMLADLMNCQSNPIKVLMFGDCVKEHWKIQVSTAVALLSPVYADPDGSRSNGPNVVVKLTKPNQLLNLGICPDFAFCKGKKRDGENCRNFVNASISERCVFHIEACARQFAARRGAFSSTSSVPPRQWQKQNVMTRNVGERTVSAPTGQVRAPAKLLSITDVRKGQKVSMSIAAAVLKNESEKLNEVLKARADSLGAKNLVKQLSKQQNEETTNVYTTMKAKSFKHFLSNQASKELDLLYSKPCLGRGQTGGEIFLRSPLKKPSSQQAAAEAAKRKAVEVLRRKREKNVDEKGLLQRKARKRLIDCDESLPGPSGTNVEPKCGLFKKAKFSHDDLKALLSKKSSHEAELIKEDQKRENLYFNNMEKKEKVESFVTSLMEVKDCNVITCKKCNYTAQKQSDYCKINGHLIVRHKANKRFYRCCSCLRRVVCYELMPTKPCPGCGEKNFERVAMHDERKVRGPEEKLLIRGEERNFVNS